MLAGISSALCPSAFPGFSGFVLGLSPGALGLWQRLAAAHHGLYSPWAAWEWGIQIPYH